jgi:hypothetical protein
MLALSDEALARLCIGASRLPAARRLCGGILSRECRYSRRKRAGLDRDRGDPDPLAYCCASLAQTRGRVRGQFALLMGAPHR